MQLNVTPPCANIVIDEAKEIGGHMRLKLTAKSYIYIGPLHLIDDLCAHILVMVFLQLYM